MVDGGKELELIVGSFRREGFWFTMSMVPVTYGIILHNFGGGGTYRVIVNWREELELVERAFRGIRLEHRPVLVQHLHLAPLLHSWKLVLAPLGRHLRVR